MSISESQLDILRRVCNLPTAPYREDFVIAFLKAWAAQPLRAAHIHLRSDRWGNLYLDYRRGSRPQRTLMLEAHMDHPGFVVRRTNRDTTITAEFRGGVPPSHLRDARVAIWLPTQISLDASPVGRWILTRVLDVKPAAGKKLMTAVLAGTAEKIPSGSIGMWALPDALVTGDLFAARVCDDLAGVAACLCVLDELIARKTDCTLTVLLTRAEEVGFAGAIAAARDRAIASKVSMIGLETSKALPQAPQGKGPIIRVGDRTSIFSSSLTRFITMRAGDLADEDSNLKFQRQLMDGGTCDTTVFSAFGCDAAAMCLALGNYHNMLQDQSGQTTGIPTAGPLIACETIHLGDFAFLVSILVQIAAKFRSYRPDLSDLVKRFARMHREGQSAMLRKKM
jgi:putative aminopeptidase FrvX